jgi:hypothetical protein
MILYFTITMGINGCILDFTTKCAQMICLLDFTTIMHLSFYHIYYTLYRMWNIFKRVCHNTRTLNKRHPSMPIIVVKSETHPYILPQLCATMEVS